MQNPSYFKKALAKSSAWVSVQSISQGQYDRFRGFLLPIAFCTLLKAPAMVG